MKTTNFSSAHIALDDDMLGDEATLNHSRFQLLYQLSQMQGEPERAITDFALAAAVKMTRSVIGFIHFINDGETVQSEPDLSNDAVSRCTVGHPQTAGLAADTGLWREAVRQRRPIIINDYSPPNPQIKGLPPGHVHIKRQMHLPLIDDGKVVLIAGVGNKETLYDDADFQQLTLVMDSMWRLVKLKRMTFALEESEARYQAIFNQSVDAIALLDAQTGAIIAFNDNMHTMLGYTREELSQLTIADVEADDSPIHLAAHIQIIREIEYDIFETHLKTRSGELRQLVVNAQLIQVSGRFLIQAILSDITEQKQSEMLLHVQKNLGVKLSASTGLSETLDTVLSIVNSWYPEIDYGVIYLLAEQTGRPYLACVSGPVPNPHIADDPDALLADDAWQQAVRLPVQHEGRQIAELVWGSKHGRIIPPAVQNTLHILAAQVGGAIASALAKEAVRRSEQKYINLVDTIDGIVWQADPKSSQFLFVSRPAERLLGYPIRQWLNEPNFRIEHVYEEDRAKVASFFVEAPAEMLEHDLEYRMVASDGRIVWFQDKVNVIVRKDQPHLLQGVMVDITERKEAEETLRQLSQAVEQSPAAIVITDPNGVIEYVNPKYSHITGNTPAEAVGHTWAILESETTGSAKHTALWQIISQGQEWRGEFYDRSKNGTYSWIMVSISPIFNANGEITHYLGVKEDISDRKELEVQLRRSNNELSLLNGAGQALSSSLDVNQVIATLLDETRGLIGISAGAVWLLDDGSGELVCQKVTGPGMNSLLELRCAIIPDSSLGWVALHGMTQHLPDTHQADVTVFADDEHDIGFESRSSLAVPLQIKNKVIGVVQILDREVDRFTEHEVRLIESLATFAANAVENARLHKDLHDQLTRLYATQSRLIQSEKLAATGEMIAGVAHELNNPLASTLLYAQLLQERITDETLANDLSQIVTQARRARGIVNGLLDFAQQRAPEWVPTDINQLLQKTLDFQAYTLQTHDINVFSQFSPSVPMTMADPHQLRQVVINLIHNALQALDKKRSGNRHLTLTTTCGPSQYDAGTADPAPVIRIVVQDNGPGITTEVISRVFDPFFTTKSPGEGTGLGLSVCHGIIAEHEGHIWVESQADQGATFYIELPIIETESLPKGSDEGELFSPAKPSQSANILIIDDEQSLLSVLTVILMNKGYHVDGVSDGATALDYLAERDYDLILSDLRMPGMSGIEFYRQAVQLHPQIKDKIVFSTGDIVSQGTQEFLDEMGVPFLSKPFELSELLRVVQEHSL